MAPLIKSKLPNTGITIFSEMTALANDVGAINLSQGFPDFPVDKELINLVNSAMQQGHNQYAPMAGLLSLRKKITEKAEALYQCKVDPVSEVNITAGATQAIYTAITAVVNEGDEVIIFTPSYDCYAPAVELNGGVPIFIPLEPPKYAIDWEQVKKLVNHRTRLVIINSPHNPTGTTWKATDIEQLSKIVEGSNILVLSDEVYEHIIFDGQTHESVLKYPVLKERSFAVFSFGKTFHATGWKMGYCIAPDELMAEFRKVHQYLVFTCNTSVQHALARYLEKPEHYLELAAFYQKKRNFFVKGLEKSRFKILPCEGTYFVLLGYADITDETDKDFAIHLTKQYGVASIPVSVFYSRELDYKVLRFCFAKEDETLKQATDILCRI